MLRSAVQRRRRVPRNPADGRDDAQARALALLETLPDGQPRELDRMRDVDVDLRVALVLLGILPEVGEGGLEDAGADAVCVRDVVPLLLAGGKELLEVGPVGDVSLDVQDVGLGGGPGVEFGGCAEVGDEDVGAEGGGLLGKGETYAGGAAGDEDDFPGLEGYIDGGHGGGMAGWWWEKRGLCKEWWEGVLVSRRSEKVRRITGIYGGNGPQWICMLVCGGIVHE